VKRRTFLQAAAAAVGAQASWTAAYAAQPATRPMKILVLGGTSFIGIPMTELALERGHTLTFFNRGRTNNELFPQVERLRGDRDGQLDALKGRKWDAVIDNSGYVPRHVRLSAELLAPNVGQYLFVSSISAYADFSVPRSEDSPVAKMADENVEKVDGASYGPLKALSEQAAERAMPGRTTVLRPGLIVGPHDNTDRFTYWPARAARGGELLAPGTPADRIQVIDARDLAAFTLDALERHHFGIFNVISPPGAFTIGKLVEDSVAAAIALAKPSDPPRPTWVPATFLAEQKVAPWSDMPVWIPEQGEEAASAGTSVQRALDKGLKIRPLANTVRDTLAWHLRRPAAQQKLTTGIDPERERQVLAAWKTASARPAAATG